MTKPGPDPWVRGWMESLTDKLRRAFSDRLLCVGLQGSRRRGEERPDSDIDAVVVLDELRMEDLRRYREIVDSMPDREKACGFIGGELELRHWPRHELFHFRNDTLVFHGDLDSLLPELDLDDLRDSVRFAAGDLYHRVAHLYVHGDKDLWPAALHDAFRSTFYILQTIFFVETGVYVPTRRRLLHELKLENRKLLEIGMHWERYREHASASPDKYFKRLLEWSKDQLAIFRVMR